MTRGGPIEGGIAGSPAPEIILDLSRLVSRLLHPTPTGVDRVEMAYARGLLARIPERLRFAAFHADGRYGRLDPHGVRAFLDHCEARWEAGGADPVAPRRWSEAARWLWRLRPRPVPPRSGPRVLLQPSHNQLDRPARIAARNAREQARFICLIHDLIPISHPEYARPGGADRHRRRIRTIEAQADAILVNSQATRDALIAHSGAALSGRPILVAPLGIDRAGAAAAAPPPGRPWFLCLGTIEPRKNHLLLLNVWRSLVERLGPERVPMLLIVGRRGWENENVLDMLDRCPGLAHTVREIGRLPDAELRPLIAGARALLMPSFAEGFGLPVGEALAAGTPVLASDLPAHREVGGPVPEYLDPLDGPAWRAAVTDYACEHSPRRAAQLDRLAGWTPPGWDDHFSRVLALAEAVARS